MTGIPCSLDPLGSGFGVPFQPQFVVFEGRPQPEQGGQDNINATVKLYRGIYNVIIAGFLGRPGNHQRKPGNTRLWNQGNSAGSGKI